MPTPDHPLPDITVGHHPDFGIVASNPKRLAAGAWMLRGLDFHPVPGHRDLYALSDQERDGLGRATRAVALLRKARYHVDADAALDPSLANSATPDRPARVAPVRIAPDVAFAEHPQLGIVAATTDGVHLAKQLLSEQGWQRHPRLDIYTLPPATGRADGLAAVARTTLAINRADLQVAVQPDLARDVTARRSPAPARSAPRERSPDTAARRFPALNAAALAASPARAGLPATPPVPAPASAPASRPVDPRVAFSRTR
ncbi:hypothetical protein OG552_15340 [Streptomyces sp. NBC_01476]|uniref:hypothetical protein n=1 Tax=Streptomyces sp. NBC_01476 TaxID=2903881 RepID=UPI002E32DFC7|nr:hypothetical protein [Streptomyces sp. NBC_01476]